VRRGEALLSTPDAPRGRVLAGTALVLTAQTRAIAKKYFAAGSAARQGHAYLVEALASDPNMVDAGFALGA